ncbi:amidohydrolase family protein [Actinophytocola sp.]|uniref:amidohydrolase family protein n=1 Tax=Actinophytocola sp. TaxID=1872138 RepID=UPI002ED46964
MSSDVDGPVFDFHARLAPVPGALERLLDVHDRCGIGAAAVSAGGSIDLLRLSRQLVHGGHVTTDPDNDAVLRACAGSSGRLLPFYFANPHRDPEHYRQRAARFVGLELSPAVHGVRLDDPRTTALTSVAEAAGQPVYVVCLARPGCGVTDLVALAERFPRVTFVLGHSGIGNIDYYGVDLIAPAANIHLETSGGYTSVVRAAIDRLGPHRVLFGSEHPLQHPDAELAKFRALDLPAADWRQIAWDNAHRLLKGNGDDPHHHAPTDAGGLVEPRGTGAASGGPAGRPAGTGGSVAVLRGPVRGDGRSPGQG